MDDEQKKRRGRIGLYVYGGATALLIGVSAYALLMIKAPAQDPQVWVPLLGAAYFGFRTFMFYNQSKGS
jgi:hypothetical protein